MVIAVGKNADDFKDMDSATMQALNRAPCDI